MTRLSKVFTYTLVLALLVSSITMVESVHAQTPAIKPSVPEFTVRYVDRSYYVEPVYGVDPYSGKTVQTGGGFTIENKTVDVAINSQSFTPYVYMDGDMPRSVFLSWQIRIKGHFEDNWHDLKTETPVWNESYRVITYLLDDLPIPHFLKIGDQIDYQVRTRIGYQVCTSGDPYDLDSWEFHGEDATGAAFKS